MVSGVAPVLSPNIINSTRQRAFAGSSGEFLFSLPGKSRRLIVREGSGDGMVRYFAIFAISC